MDEIDPRTLQILTYPAPILRQKAAPIEGVTDWVRQVARRMLELMREVAGVGLAGPQVGVPLRLFVANTVAEREGDRVFINPILSRSSRRTEQREEGCLSLPEVTGMIRRPYSITIDAIDLDGNEIHLMGEDLMARAWQHETDHLDGILIVDRMARIDLVANRPVLQELEEGAARPEGRKSHR